MSGGIASAGGQAANPRPAKRPVRGNRPAARGRPISAPPPSPLQASVLVLNRLYLAVHVVGVRRAFGCCAANWPK